MPVPPLAVVADLNAWGFAGSGTAESHLEIENVSWEVRVVPAESMSFINPDGSLKSVAEIKQQSRELIEAAQKQAREASEAILALVGEGASRDGAAKVTVGATGALQAVRLNDRVKSMTPAQIAASVMEAYGAAARNAAEAAQAAAAERPRGDQVLAAIRRLVPQQEDAEGQSW